MKKNRILTVNVLLVVCLFLVSASACAPEVKPPQQQEKVLKLGCLMPFSGPAAMYGERGRQITDILIELINEDGDVKIGQDTYKVALYWGDDQFAPAPAAAAARKLIYDDGVIAILGYIGPGFSALSPVTNPEKVILICRTGDVIYDPFSMVITHLSQYLECAQKAGTTDPDVMMKTFKGGTFDSFLGRYTYMGTKTYGAPVVFGYPCAMGEIKGDKEVYIGEYPLVDADMWYDYLNPK